MCIQALESCQADDRITEALEPLARQFLHGHLAHELVYAQAIVVTRKAVRRQDMVRAAAVVADRLRCPTTDEHGTGIAHPGHRGPGIVNLQNEMLRCVVVADCDCRLDIFDDDDARATECGTGDIGSRQPFELRT